jgi:UDP-N-acetylmuramate dehydrogenase
MNQTSNSALADRLRRDGEIGVACGEAIAPYTSYRIGGPAALRVVPRSEAAVGRALQILHAAGQRFFVLGGGTNLLISDLGWDGVVLHIDRHLAGWRFQGRQATVLAGSRLLDFIRQAVAAGQAGMESMAGIPGNIGGALRMNAGAFGQEIEAVTESVHGFRPDGTPFRAQRGEIDFGYRCAPALEDVVITSTVLRFRPGDPAALQARLEEILARRAARQPLEYPSCGSVFKRPPGHYAGALIEQAGLKGERIGGAMVSSKHAGFIINIDNATADDVYRLIRKIQARVHETFQVELEREVKLIGEFRL